MTSMLWSSLTVRFGTRQTILAAPPRGSTGAVPLGDATAWLGRRRLRSDGEHQFTKRRRKPVVGWFVGGDVVVAACEVLDESLSSGNDAS